MKLANPYALLWLLLVPGLFFLSQRWQRPAAISYPTIRELVTLPPTFMTQLRRALPVLRVLAFIFCILALARPQWGIEAVKVYGEGIAIAMVVDISSSMAALDLQLNGNQSNRLDVVKQTFRTFVQGGDLASTGRDGDLFVSNSFSVAFSKAPPRCQEIIAPRELALALSSVRMDTFSPTIMW